MIGSLCLETYRRGAFMGSALVVGKATRKPNQGFWTLMRDIGALTAADEAARAEFWLCEVAKADEWYQQNEW